MKNIKVTMLIATATTAFAVLMANQPNAVAGNDGSGGGGGSPRQLADKRSIIAAIKSSKLILETILNSVEASYLKEKGQGDYSNWKNVFESNKNPRQVLRNAQITMQDAPCIYEGKKTDGSAQSPDKICVSVGRLLKKKYSSNDIMPYVMGLVGHEFSHLMGTNEKQAQQIQTQIESEVQSSPTYAFLGELQGLDEKLYKIGSEKIDLGTEISLIDICSSAGLFLSDIEDLESKMESVSKHVIDGYQGIISYKQSLNFTDAKIRLSNILVNGCGVRVNKKSAFSSTAYGQIIKSYQNSKLSMLQVLDFTYQMRVSELGGQVPTYWWRSVSSPYEDCKLDRGAADCLGRDKIVYEMLNADDLQATKLEMLRAVSSYAISADVINDKIKEASWLLGNI